MTIIEAKAALLNEFRGKPITFQDIAPEEGKGPSFRVFTTLALAPTVQSLLEGWGFTVAALVKHSILVNDTKGASLVASEQGNE